MEEKAARSTAEIGFVIEVDAAAAMMKEWGVATAPELLVALVPSALRMARPPISNFPVGAVGLGESGRIYVGVNMEFPGLPLHHSIHAEQFLVTNAAVHGETGIRCIAVSSAPCGHCRQFLQELRRAADIQILVTSDGPGSAFLPLSSFLPRPFGPPDLLHKDHPLLLEPHDNKIALLDDDEDAKAPAGGGICNGIGGDLEERLRAAAEGAARASHAPYSKCPAGFAVADGEGRVYAGSYEESAAYNPSLGPVQAAAVAYVAAGCGGGGAGKGYGFVAAALAEAEGVPVSHEATARVFLAVVAPRAHLKVYRFHSSAAT
ncbi:cytidine deaminase 1-like [Phoenix dactylifera]|uniref:cytidine deaminase n=1 Tax=Phoenix dactylifera TaxID=42345 RepID=A0A8B7CEN9_PHODC|nr:cytidine deaminase 1-like [Phoenix dactylifera]